MRVKWLHLYCFLTCVCTLILLCAGALVTSTGSGLAVPDWPLSYGKLFPPLVGGVFFEHGHRLIAGFVASLTVIQALLIQRFDSRKSLRRVAWLAVGLVLSQATLGGLTVLFRLPPQISVAHACLAQLFFCTTVLMTLMTSGFWFSHPTLLDREKWESARLPEALLLLNFLFFLQLLVGATMRHLGAGLAIPDFPLVFGGVVPKTFTFPILVHYLHRVGAVVIVIYSAVTAWRIQKRYFDHLELVLGIGMLLALLSTQVLLAATIIWMKRPIPITVAHLVVGASCFGSSVWLTGRAFRLRSLAKDARDPLREPGVPLTSWRPSPA